MKGDETKVMKNKNGTTIEKTKWSFNYAKFSERLVKLMEENGDTANSLERVFKKKKYAECFDVRLSHTNLRSYTNPNAPQSVTIGNLVAIADYFKVTVAYLIGESDSKSDDAGFKSAGKWFGLSDSAMKEMKYMFTHKDLILPPNYKKCGEMELINYMIVHFSRSFREHILDYFRAYEDLQIFIENYMVHGDGKESRWFLDLDGLPPGSEDILIDDYQEKKREVDLKRLDIMAEMERFLLSLRNELLTKGDRQQ